MPLEQAHKEQTLVTAVVITVVLAGELVDYHIMVMELLEQLALVVMVEVIHIHLELQEQLVKYNIDL